MVGLTLTKSGWLYIIVLFTGIGNVVIGQDCDSFVCLREFHGGMTTTVGGTSTLCSITQAYLSCLRRSTVICTSLTIQEMTDMASLLMTHAECGTGSNKAGFILTVIAACIVRVLSV
ncbi:uncharacterized protein [Haliotis cracherodii]|uniref:uncharacterized protein n=1 Tax=Haliotis cracherodii TaxID=6455 RepID=UPI0039EC4F9B